MLTTTVTTKGQVVIPASLRKKLRLQKGAKLGVSEKDGQIIMELLTEDPIKAGRGMLTTRGAVLRQLAQDRMVESQR
jgi:AbrB family looped-hinge helix DNA binding protein